MSLEDLIQRSEEKEAYILVDWDRTLVKYDSWEKNKTSFGQPIAIMVERVQRWLHTGMEVRIFTARVSHPEMDRNNYERKQIEEACKKMFGQELKVQNWKCFRCIAIWDDLAVTVEPNTGWRMTSSISGSTDPLSFSEEKAIDIVANPRNRT